MNKKILIEIVEILVIGLIGGSFYLMIRNNEKLDNSDTQDNSQNQEQENNSTQNNKDTKNLNNEEKITL